MKITLNFSQFCDEWNKWDDRKNTFSYQGKKALFEYLENYEEETGEEIELDIVALCCDYTEFENFKDYQAQYGDKIENIEKLSDYTQVIPIDGSEAFIIQQY